MYGDSGRSPVSPLTLIVIFIIAIVAIMGVTVALNGGTSSPAIEENDFDSNNDTNVTNQTAYSTAVIGNNSYGQVSKLTGLGNSSSDIRIALILGVDQVGDVPNSIVPTLENDKNLSYSYDIYIVKTQSGNLSNGDENNSNNLTENDMSEQLAAEYVVPDVVNNNYNLTLDIHSTSDSNSYLFVPVDTTYTSKKVMEAITDKVGIGEYTPENHKFTESVSEPIISYEIPSIVYVSREYSQNGTSTEIGSVIDVIDSFDFKKLFEDTSDSSTTSNDTNSSYDDSYSTNQSYTNKSYSSNDSSYSE